MIYNSESSIKFIQSRLILLFRRPNPQILVVSEGRKRCLSFDDKMVADVSPNKNLKMIVLEMD